MRIVVATILGLALVATAHQAAAYVVTVATSVPARSIADADELKAAVRSAIDTVLRRAIAFAPTFVTLEAVRIVDGQLYILLVIGDDEGEAMMRALAAGAGPGPDSAERPVGEGPAEGNGTRWQ